MQLRDSVVIVTGASRGLGRALTLNLGSRGANLVLTARDPEPLNETTRALGAGARFVAMPGDVADTGHAERLIAAAVHRFGRVDVVINNASTIGPSPMPRLDAYPPHALDRVFRVNVTAPLHLASLAIAQMRQSKDGVIVNITSDAAVQAYPGWGGYGASKAALEHASRVLAAELEGSGIRVYVVDPGDMNTRMHQDAEPGVNLSHLAVPEQVAPAVIDIIERETAAFGRFEAQARAVAVL
jgi:NAD(P)-dependent dehydrogenase (short-subunit alcohol dehydrogenase family)